MIRWDPTNPKFENWLASKFMNYKTIGIQDEYKDDWIYEWNIDIPWVYEKPWTDAGVWTREWPTCSWKKDGFCNGGNLPGAYIIGNSLHYQDYEWYEALKDRELKEEALRNKVIMEGLIDDDNDDESGYEQMK
ncbi:hypothetical protein Tco_1484574 [Tanacetum coccineum]